MDTTDEWIRTRTGIERRHIAADGETTVDLAEHAARRALEAAGVAPAEVDFIVFGTTTPDLVFPNCGVLLQERLGCRGCRRSAWRPPAAGFMYALSIADKFVRCGRGQVRAGDRRGDALAHHRLERSRHRGAVRRRRGRRGARSPRASPGMLSHAPACRRRVQGPAVLSPVGVSKGFRSTGTSSRMHQDDRQRGLQGRGHQARRGGRRGARGQRPRAKSAIDWLVPHQANIRIIQAMATQLDLPMERVIVTVAGPRQHLGGLGAAGARCRRARRAHQARRAAAARSLRRRLYLGLGAGPLLAARCRADGRPFDDAKKTPRDCAAFL